MTRVLLVLTIVVFLAVAGYAVMQDERPFSCDAGARLDHNCHTQP